MRILRWVLLTLAVFACLQPIRIARADEPVAAAKRFVLIPYQESTENDTFGPKVTAWLLSDLTAAGIDAVSIDPIDHLTECCRLAARGDVLESHRIRPCPLFLRSIRRDGGGRERRSFASVHP
jgi:hypothetical protein